jgi:hypothetical protein
MNLSKLFSRCVTHSYIHTSSHAELAIDRIGGRLYLFFQDSEGAVDWMRNLDFLPASDAKRDGQVLYYHRGFLRVWRSLADRLTPEILDREVSEIITVGYSHGAALALLCHETAWRLRPDLRQRNTGYGFGCPRVVWGNVTEEVAYRWKNFTVIRNREDIVTHIPPRFLGYTHVGSLLEIGERGKYTPIDAHRPKNIARELSLYEMGEGFPAEK